MGAPANSRLARRTTKMSMEVERGRLATKRHCGSIESKRGGGKSVAQTRARRRDEGPRNASAPRDEAGWSRQKPVERASQRNEEALKNWSDERWPDIKKKPKKKRPPSSGQTPLLRVKLTRDHRIVRSVASLWMDACSCKCGLPRITRKPWLVSCASTYARCAGKIVLIWDGSPIHRAHEIKDFLKRGAA